jgi:hypothetical protein
MFGDPDAIRAWLENDRSARGLRAYRERANSRPLGREDRLESAAAPAAASWLDCGGHGLSSGDSINSAARNIPA